MEASARDYATVISRMNGRDSDHMFDETVVREVIEMILERGRLTKGQILEIYNLTEENYLRLQNRVLARNRRIGKGPKRTGGFTLLDRSRRQSEPARNERLLLRTQRGLATPKTPFPSLVVTIVKIAGYGDEPGISVKNLTMFEVSSTVGRTICRAPQRTAYGFSTRQPFGRLALCRTELEEDRNRD